MPTFSRGLEQSLHRALALANERHHEYATLEHLLLALIEDEDAAAVMRACNVDLQKLRRRLVDYLESELDNLITDGADDSKPPSLRSAKRWRCGLILQMLTITSAPFCSASARSTKPCNAFAQRSR